MQYEQNNQNNQSNLVSTIIIFAIVEGILLATIVGAFVMGYITTNFFIIGLVAASTVFLMGVVPAIMKSKQSR